MRGEGGPRTELWGMAPVKGASEYQKPLCLPHILPAQLIYKKKKKKKNLVFAMASSSTNSPSTPNLPVKALASVGRYEAPLSHSDMCGGLKYEGDTHLTWFG
jgi:hypothetical protein